jgi:putative hydrolase of the HAD superfamily
MDRYKAYTKQTNRELKPEEIWPDYYLKDLPFDKTGLSDDICEELAHMWEDTNFSRALRPGVVEMLDGLKSLGLRLGVVSNNASLFQVFTVLENYGIRDYFEDVTVSSVVGYRKPHPHIFDVALRQFRMQEHPEECAYVGDTLSRDVIGPQQAGFGETFQIKSFLTASRDVDCVGKAHADHDIADISEVYTILKEELGR